MYGFGGLGQCPAGRVFQYRVGSGRVLDKIPGSGSGSGRVGVSKNTFGYFQVSFFLAGISGHVGCFGYFWVSGSELIRVPRTVLGGTVVLDGLRWSYMI